MTVPATTRRAGPFLGNDVATSFPFTFKVFSSADIELTLTDADAVETVLVLDSDYSVSVNADQTASPGGTITYPLSGSPLATGETLVCLGALPYDQTAAFPAGGNYRAQTHENAFDRTVFQIQQLAEELGRALTLAPSAATGVSVQLPAPEALKAIGWNLSEDALINLDVSGGGGGSDIPTTAGHVGEFLSNDGPNLIWAPAASASIAAFGIHAIDYVPADMRAAIRDGTSTDDVTEYMQAALVAASNSMTKTVYFCAGLWNHTSAVFGCYDAALNPDYNILRNGEIYLVGEGIAPENGGVGGTKFLGLNASGNGFVITPSTENSSPWRPRDFRAYGITFESATTGFVVQLEGCPGAEFVDCEIVNTNAAGSGLKLSSSWFGGANKLRVRVPFGGASTGKAVEFGITPGIYSGLAAFKGLNVGGYAYGFHFTEGGWQNIAFTDSALVGSTYAFYCGASAGVDSLSFHDCYFEGACTSFIAQDGADRIRKLTIGGNTWMYSIGCTGPMIDLDQPNAVAIDNLYIQDPRTAIMNIANAVSGSTGCYTVGNIVTGYPTSFPVPPFTLDLFTGVIPVFGTVQYPEANTYIRLCDPATHLGKVIKQRANYAGGGTAYAHRMVESDKVYTGLASGTDIYLAADGYPTHVYVEATTSANALLPVDTAGLPGGFSFYITAGASNTVVVKKETGLGTVATVTANTTRKFTFYRDAAGAVVGWR